MFGTLANAGILIGTSLAKDLVVSSDIYKSFQSGFVNPILDSSFGKGISNIFSGPSTTKALAEAGGNLTKAAGESVVNQLLRQGLGADPSDLGSGMSLNRVSGSDTYASRNKNFGTTQAGKYPMGSSSVVIDALQKSNIRNFLIQKANSAIPKSNYIGPQHRIPSMQLGAMKKGYVTSIKN